MFLRRGLHSSCAKVASLGLKEAVDQLELLDGALDSGAYGSLLRKCSNARALSEGKRVHVHIARSVCDPDTFLGNLLVQMYGTCNSLEDARLAFEKIRKPNSFSWNIMISAYIQNGHLDEARRLFERMPNTDVVSWTSMVAAFAQEGNLQDARYLFGRMPERNVVSWNAMLGAYAQSRHLVDVKIMFDGMPQRTVTSWNTMMTAYAQNGYTKDAKRVFDEMPERDVISWNGIVAACAQYGHPVDAIDRNPRSNVLSSNALSAGSSSSNGHLEDARSTFDRMPQHDVVSCNTLIAAYAQSGLLQDASILFTSMPRRDAFAWATMIVAYLRNGHLDEARSTFEEMPQPDILSWSVMIAAYAQNGLAKPALELLGMMDLEGVQPDDVTYISILDGFANSASLAEGKLVHASIVDNGLESHPVVGTALVNMYGKCKQVNEARRVFNKLLHRDVIAWTAMITAYAQNGDMESAKNMFEESPERNVATWNTMIAAYNQNGHAKDSIDALKRMDQEGVLPNEITYVSTLDASASLSALSEGKMIHACILDNGFQSIVTVGTALVSMYGKCGCLDEARRIFNSLSQRDSVSWAAMVAAYCQNGHGKDALELFQVLKLEGMMPDEIIFVSILSVCSHAGLFRDGWHYFLSLTGDYGIVPLVDHYVCMVDLLGRAGKLQEAEELINSMPYEPDAVAWVTLMTACRNHGDSRRAEEVLEHTYKLEPENAAPFILLSSIHGTA